MSIINIFDFEDKLQELINIDESSDPIQYQGSIMNSDNVITSFVIIENELNKIYEKIRIIEDLNDYAENYVNNEIKKQIQKCKDISVEISNLNDIIYNRVSNYKTINVPIKNLSGNEYKDRDGSMLQQARVNNGAITLKYETKEKFAYSLESIESAHVPYERISTGFEEGNPYRAHYIEEGIDEDGIIEYIRFKFNKDVSLNNVEISPVNCSECKIAYVYVNGTISKFQEINPGLLANKNVAGIIIMLKCTNYTETQIKKYYIDDPILQENRVTYDIDDDNNIYTKKTYELEPDNNNGSSVTNVKTKKELESLFRESVIKQIEWKEASPTPVIKYPIPVPKPVEETI